MMPWPVPWSEVPPGADVLHNGETWRAWYVPPPIAQANLYQANEAIWIDAAPTAPALMFVPDAAEAVATLLSVFPTSELVSE